jgi:hypothetical protein
MPITVTNNNPSTGPTLVQSGNTTFYKYEPFEYTFTDGANTLTVSTQNFPTYFSGSGSTTVTFSAPIKGFTSTGSQSGDTFTITSSGGSTAAFTLFVLSGRFQGSNVLTAYIGETLNATYTSIPDLTLAYPSPTLPPGLSFSLLDSNTVVVGGRPTSISPSSNYLFYGSNSNTGYTVSQLVSIQICNARVTVSPSTFSAVPLTVNEPLPVVTLTNTTPSQNVLSFQGSLPIGLSWNPVAGTSTTLTGTPGVPQSGSFTTICTVIDTVTNAFTLVTIPFVYTEVVEFTAPTQRTWNVWSNIPIQSTYDPGIQLLAETKYGSGTGMTYTSSPTAPAFDSNGLITGTVPASGSFIFTGKNDSNTTGTITITFNLSQAFFTVSGVPSTVSAIVGKAIPPFSFTVSTAGYKNPIITRTTANIPNGLTVGGSGQTFTISGIPTTNGVTTGTITVASPNVTTLTIPIIFNTSADTISFVPTPGQSYAFAQNILITPIQISATPTNGAPVTFYSGALPLGLNISSTGLIQGIPLSSGSGSFTVTATNGYTTVTAQYFYVIAVDTMICYSTSGNSFPLTANTAFSIPITTVLRSGTSIKEFYPGYLYGLTLTPTLLSGVFRTAVYPDVVVQSNTIITIVGSNFANSVSSTFFQLSGTTLQTKYNSIAILSNTVGGIKPKIYYSTDSFKTLTPATIGGASELIMAPPITDFQSEIPGGNAFMIANKTAGTYYSTDGGQTYVQRDNPDLNGTIYQVAYANSNWYGIASVEGASKLVSGLGWNTLETTPTVGPSPRVDGGLVLRAVKTPQAFPDPPRFSLSIDTAVGDGTQITYELAEAIGIDNGTSGIFSFSGFSNNGYNLDSVRGTITGAFTITVASTSNIPLEERVSTQYGSVVMYTLAPSRLLFGGIGLFYASPANPVSIYQSTSCLLEEIHDLSTNVPTMIIAAGGHRSDDQPSSPYKTLQYSTDYGLTWSTSSNDFSWYATSVVWGGHMNPTEGTTRSWIALGYNNTGNPGIKYSTDGKVWIDANIGITLSASTELGPLQFDGTNWNLVVSDKLYTHDANPATLAIPGQWTATVIGGITGLCSTPYCTGGASGITLQVGTTSGGPTFSSPTVLQYTGFQYVAIEPIIFDTLSSGTSFFLASTLPAGLTWTPAILNPNVTTNIYATITGQPVILGTSIIDVYAEDLVGISKITITIITQPIPFKTPDTTPSGYTNFLKEKAIADSAVSSINNRALVSPVGTFLANAPQPVTLAPEICCLNPSTQ